MTDTVLSLARDAGKAYITFTAALAGTVKLIRPLDANARKLAFVDVVNGYAEAYGLETKVSRKANDIPGNLTFVGGKKECDACRFAVVYFLRRIREELAGEKAKPELCEVPSEILALHEAVKQATAALTKAIGEYETADQRSIRASLAALKADKK